MKSYKKRWHKVYVLRLTSAIIFLVFLVLAWIYTDYNVEDKKIKCYDRYSNEIEGQTCIDKTSIQEVISGNVFITFIIIVLYMILFDLIEYVCVI